MTQNISLKPVIKKLALKNVQKKKIEGVKKSINKNKKMVLQLDNAYIAMKTIKDIEKEMGSVLEVVHQNSILKMELMISGDYLFKRRVAKI